MRGARMLYSYDDAKPQLDADSLKVEAKADKHPFSHSKILEIVESMMLLQPFENADANDEDPERVLFCLLPNNPIRQMFLWISKQVLFDTVVYISILVSCFFLIVERPFKDLVDYPGQQDSLPPLVPITQSSMNFYNSIFTFVFTVEFFCRVMAQGLFFTKHAYLKSGWNIVDTLVLVFAWIEEVVDGPSYKALRMGRALKPLRLMKRNQSMRVVIDALICTLQPLVYVILFLVFTLVIFSLMAMGLFGGKLYTCNDPSLAHPMGKAECSHYWVRDDGVILPSAWERPYTFHFDTYGGALMSLMQVSTFKYVSILFACMDVTSVDQMPKLNNSGESALFFVVYIFVGGLFVMNLFVGFIIDGFNANKGSSNEEMIYGRFRRQLYSSRPKYTTFKPPANKYSKAIRRFLESPVFQAFSTACVVTNVMFLLADNADAQPGTHLYFLLETQNNAFFIELCAEMVLCLFAYGLGGFYNDVWRGFDLFVCLGQSVGMIAQNPTISRGAKVFRLARVVRLAARIKSVRTILEIFIHTVPQLSNIILLIFLFYSMAGVMGVTFFATTKFGLRLGSTANFRVYTEAFVTIFHIVTGDEWHVLMIDLSVQEPYCNTIFTKNAVPGYNGPDRTWGDCGQTMSPVFFLFIKLLCEYMLLNLFIGLILDNFSYITEDVGHEEDAQWSNGPSGDQLEILCDVFKLFDKGTGFMPITSLHSILLDLPLPLGYRKSDGKLRIKERDKAMEILIRAELNLAMRHDRDEMLHTNNNWMHRLGLKKPKIKKLFTNAVEYEVLMVTLLHWRVPLLVPNLIKWQRQERVEECSLVAHALQCVEFFRVLVCRRKRKKIGIMLAKRSRFMHWSDQDPHRKRRNVHNVAKRMEHKEIAQSMKLPLLLLLNKPINTSIIVLEWMPIDDIPTEMIDHSKAAREHHLMRVPQPITGIDVLRQKVATHWIVMRLIDPNNKDPIGDLVMADMSHVRWREWHPVNSKHESYFEPAIWAGIDDNNKINPHKAWDRVDFYIKSKSSTVKVRQQRLGSLEEMQSYVVDDPHSTETRAADRARSHMRINLGNHQYNSDKVKMHATKYNEARKQLNLCKSTHCNTLTQHAAAHCNTLQHTATCCNTLQVDDDFVGGDAVLEIVGYLPLSSFP